MCHPEIRTDTATVSVPPSYQCCLLWWQWCERWTDNASKYELTKKTSEKPAKVGNSFKVLRRIHQWHSHVTLLLTCLQCQLPMYVPDIILRADLPQSIRHLQYRHYDHILQHTSWRPQHPPWNLYTYSGVHITHHNVHITYCGHASQSDTSYRGRGTVVSIKPPQLHWAKAMMPAVLNSAVWPQPLRVWDLPACPVPCSTQGWWVLRLVSVFSCWVVILQKYFQMHFWSSGDGGQSRVPIDREVLVAVRF